MPPDGGAIRSRHCLTFVPRSHLDAESVGGFDRLLVKAEATSEKADALAPRLQCAVNHLGGRPGFAFDAVLDDRWPRERSGDGLTVELEPFEPSGFSRTRDVP